MPHGHPSSVSRCVVQDALVLLQATLRTAGRRSFQEASSCLGLAQCQQEPGRSRRLVVCQVLANFEGQSFHGSKNNLASKRETQKPSLGVGTWFLLVFNKVFERKENLRWGCSLVETGIDLSDENLLA